MARTSGRPRGALEQQVLACLAAADHPMTVGEVQADLGAGLGRWLPPATAVRLLAAAMLATALATGFTLAVAGFVLIAQLPVVAVLGHWSTTVVETTEPLPDPLGGLAGLTVALLLVASA